MILPVAIGEVAVFDDITPDAVGAALEMLGRE
jgi:hypothetical protein